MVLTDPIAAEKIMNKNTSQKCRTPLTYAVSVFPGRAKINHTLHLLKRLQLLSVIALYERYVTCLKTKLTQYHNGFIC